MSLIFEYEQYKIEFFSSEKSVDKVLTAGLTFSDRVLFQ